MLPQLDLTHYTSQMFWLLVSLAVLVIAMQKVFVPRMNGIITRREKTIVDNEASLTELKRLRDELMNRIENQRTVKAREYAIEMEKEDDKCNAELTAHLIQLNDEHQQMIKKLKEQYKGELEKIKGKELQDTNALVDIALERLTVMELRR